jgi:hypothetical protein
MCSNPGPRQGHWPDIEFDRPIIGVAASDLQPGQEHNRHAYEFGYHEVQTRISVDWSKLRDSQPKGLFRPPYRLLSLNTVSDRPHTQKNSAKAGLVGIANFQAVKWAFRRDRQGEEAEVSEPVAPALAAGRIILERMYHLAGPFTFADSLARPQSLGRLPTTPSIALDAQSQHFSLQSEPSTASAAT